MCTDPHELKEVDENRLFKKLGLEINSTDYTPTITKVIPDTYRKYIIPLSDKKREKIISIDLTECDDHCDRCKDLCF